MMHCACPTAGRAEIIHLDGDWNVPEFWDALGGFVDVSFVVAYEGTIIDRRR
jgi:hypothetical protein